MTTVDITDNSAEVRAALEQAKARALEIIGGKAESYAKALCAPRGPKGNPFPTALAAQVRNSIAHKATKDGVAVGSNLDIAVFVELGTSKQYKAPPDWIQTDVKPGPNSGLDKWWFYDKRKGELRIGLPMAPTPYLRPAFEKHFDEYKNIIENELKKG